MSEEMPKWPPPLRVSAFREQWARDEAIAIAAHCAANYEATLARLHKAVEALNDIKVAHDSYCEQYYNVSKHSHDLYDIAWRATEVIGPLPALPTREPR